MTDINDIKRELGALTAKVAACEAEKATKRNWPERIEAGMCFERNGSQYVWLAGQLIDLDRDTTWAGFAGFDGDEASFAYLGKLDLTIRTDAHEPTGAELAFPTDPPSVSVPLARWNDIFGAIRWYGSSAYWNNKLETLSRELKDEDARLAK